MNNPNPLKVLAPEVEKQIKISHQRLREIQEYAQHTSYVTHDLIDRATAELAAALEELEVTVEALQNQHDILLTTQESLIAEQRRYEQLFLLAPDIYLVTNGTGVVQEANKNAASAFGVSSNYLKGKPLTIFVPNSQQQVYWQHIEEIRYGHKDEMIHEWEITLKSRQKQEFPAAITTSVARDETGNVLSIHWSIRDISDRKAAEAMRCKLDREQEASEYKSRLIRTVSHELRSPLHIFNMAMQLLEIRSQQSFDQPDIQMLFQKLHNANDSMVRLLDNILTLSAMEKGKAQVIPKTVDLEAVCQKLVQKYQLYTERHQTLIFEQVGEFQEAWLDENLLQLVLGNLLSNGIKYSRDNGEVKFRVEARGDRVIFQIADNGIGIPATDMEYLFEPFYRAGNTKQAHGNGLGLSIVKDSVTLLGGEIDCESTEGIGTTFTVQLPWRCTLDIATKL
jgi:PAS domain S-box-containing protein